MTAMLLDDCAHFSVVLHAFIVMPSHVHVLVTLPPGRSISQFMHSLKRRSALEFLPLCTAGERRGMVKDGDFGARAFWQRSVQSAAIGGGRDFLVKVEYVCRNPLKDGLVARTEDYRWSSYRWAALGLWTELGGLPPDQMRAFFAASHPDP